MPNVPLASFRDRLAQSSRILPNRKQMRFTIRHLMLTTALVAIATAFLLGLYRRACAPTSDEHYAGIGKEYSFASLSFENARGSTFQLTPAELRRLEQSWQFNQFDPQVPILTRLSMDGVSLRYSGVLSDGFKMNFDAQFGECENARYLVFTLVGDGGGFQADCYWMLLRIERVLNQERMDEFTAWAAR